MAYTKLFNEIIASTIWAEPNPTRILWITLLALRGRDHVIEASIPGLAHYARISEKECLEAIETLSSPDPYSRSKEDDGRRIRAVDGGFFLINGEKYRQKMSREERLAKQVIYQKNYRERQKEKQEFVSDSVSTLTNISTELAQTEEEEKEKVKKEYRESSDSLPQNLIDFEQFWHQWPKKRGKQGAIKAWQKLKRDEQELVMQDLLTRPTADDQWLKNNGEFIPYPATYLNGKRWEDQYKKEKTFEERLNDESWMRN